MRIKNQTMTQVSFVTDMSLKKRALQKAKKEGVTLKALLTMAMKSYVNNNLELGLKQKDEFFDDVFSSKAVIKKSNELGEALKDL